MTDTNRSWEQLIERHHAEAEMSEQHAATLWDRLVQEHPEAAQLVLIRGGSALARNEHRTSRPRRLFLVTAAGDDTILTVPATSRRGLRDRLARALDGIQGTPATRDW